MLLLVTYGLGPLLIPHRLDLATLAGSATPLRNAGKLDGRRSKSFFLFSFFWAFVVASHAPRF